MNPLPEMDDEIALFDIYEPTFQVDDEVALPAYHWQFYSRIDGVSTSWQICQEMDFPAKAATNALVGLLRANAIRKRLWTYPEFFPAGGTIEPEKQAQETGNSQRDGKTFLLKDVIDFIRSRSSSDMEGKLMVYRVFLQIPPDLLKEEGITSFDFNSNHVEVRGEKLLGAISQATSNVVGVPYSWN
ncbi:MAG: hypothetical protein AAF571_09515 [Verrucomicrobiota bacterium]